MPLNSAFVRLRQLRNTAVPIVSTFSGMLMEVSAVQPSNALFPMLVTVSGITINLTV